MQQSELARLSKLIDSSASIRIWTGAVASAESGGPIEIAVGSLYQKSRLVAIGTAGLSTKCVQQCVASSRSNSEDRAASVPRTCPAAIRSAQSCDAVKIPIRSLQQPISLKAVGTLRLRAEAVKHGHAATGRHPEDRAIKLVRATAIGRTVKTAVVSLHERAKRHFSIRAIRSRTKIVDGAQRPIRCDLKDVAGT